MKYIFNGQFSEDIQSYIKLRCSLGYKEDTYARRLHSFDKFCNDHHSSACYITQEIVEHWCTLRPNEKAVTLQLRTRILRDFTKYLISIGKTAYVIPDGFVGKGEPFVPYLYSELELRYFFENADKLPPHKLSPFREYVIPVLFRILYCCGLRPQEVRHLKVNEVNLLDGSLYISHSKRNKDRIVVMSDDLLQLCIHYNKLIEEKLPQRVFFFENPNGGAYSATWIQQQFFKCWKYAGISFEREHRPRVYDWRHNFATQRIVGWMNEGKNVMNLIAYLSTYMGHDSLNYTAYYIHLVPEHLKPLQLVEWSCNIEVPDYED